MGGAHTDADGATKFVPLRLLELSQPRSRFTPIALQYHEVKVILNHATSQGFSRHFKQMVIYLDTEERRRFAQVSHEYLIEQVQEQTVTAAGTSELNLTTQLRN